MKQLYVTLILLLFVFFQVTAQSNVAPYSTNSTSYVSSWETIAALNDGFTHTNSNDKSHGACGNWNNPNSLQWVQYDWTSDYVVSSIQVYWFDDVGGVLTPTRPMLSTEDGSAWINAGNIPLVKNAFNTAAISNITLRRIRVTVRAQRNLPVFLNGV